jgi:hypothetical protein
VLGHEAVILNWRLFWRSLGQSSGALWIVIAMALLAAATMGRSAVELGDALAANQLPRDQADLLLGLWLWSTFLAAFAYSLATGEISFIRNLFADLALRPVSRWQAFVATQGVWTIGPHALALASVGLPFLIVLATWLSGTALLAAIVATFVMMRLPSGLLITGSRLLSASLATAATAVILLLVTIVVLWLAAPNWVIAWSPPGLVSWIVLDDVTSSAWIGLAVWTLVVGTAEYCSTGLDRAPRSAPVSPAVQTRPIPAAVTFLARLGGCPAVLLHGELLRLVRWRRYQLTWLAGALFVALPGARMNDHTGLIRVTFLSLVLVNMGGVGLTNLFATDRAAFYSLLMAPTGMAGVLRAKVLAIQVFCLAGAFAGATLFLVRGVDWRLVGFSIFLAAGFFMWAAAVGMISSALFPSPSDPQTVGGALVNTPAFVVLTVGNGLYLGGAVGVAYMFEWRHWSWPACGAAGAALVLAAALAMREAARVSSRLIAMRQEAMLATLTSPEVRT